MSPLYILHDYRILLDHLLSADKISETKEHIINTLGVQNFDDQETIYIEEIKRLNTLAIGGVFLLRCLEIGISIRDLDYLTIGMVMDIWTEKANDSVKYDSLAMQENFDKF